jgi:hypothetical protein
LRSETLPKREIAKMRGIIGYHFVYEVEMLKSTFALLQNGADSQVIANALIESFCLHARILVDFFKGHGGAAAAEFADGYEPFKGGNIRAELITKLNTQIAHLTYQRTAVDAQKIETSDRAELFSALTREIEFFCTRVKPEFRPRAEGEREP